jgi:hypothetical protein
MGGVALTQKVIPYASELDATIKLGVAEDLARHALLAYFVLVNAHFLRHWVDSDDAWREAGCKLVRKVCRYWFLGVQDEMWEQTIRCRC